MTICVPHSWENGAANATQRSFDGISASKIWENVWLAFSGDVDEV
jgi:hypothetical protein